MKIQNTKQFSIGYFRGTDVLRFICAAGVIFHHATLMLTEKGTAVKAEAIHRYSGTFFLDVFFIISGFLIPLILMKEHETGSFSLKNFYMRRIIRVWPLFFLAVFIKIFLFPSLKGVPMEVISTNLLHAFTFTINFQLLFSEAVKTYTILWSICIEEHIYLILPFLLLLFKKNFGTVSFFLIVTGLISWFYFMNIPSKSGLSTPYFMSTSYFYYFGIGLLIACIKNGTLPGKVLEKVIFRPLIQILIFLIFFSFIFNLWGNHSSLGATLLINGIFGGYLVWASIQENFILNLKPALSRYLGNISYAMYISHIIIISFTIALFKKKGIHFSEALWGWGIPFISAILCVGLSTLLYYYFERPILKLKKKFTTVINKE